MMSRWIRQSGYWFLSLCLLSAAPVRAAVVDEITWLLLDLPPWMILVDGKPTEGMSDIRRRMVFDRMPEYKQTFVVAPTIRIKAIMEEENPKACFALSLITPAHEKRFYAAPIEQVLPHSVIVREEIIAKIPRTKEGKVDFAALVNSPNLRGLINKGRSYSDDIDEKVAKRAANSGLSYVTSIKGNSNAFKMLSQGRADYTVEYEELWMYAKRNTADLSSAKLKALPIDNAKLLTGGIVCPRTAWGRDAIIKIRNITSQLASNPEFQNRTNRWQSPETLSTYKVALDQFYKEMGKPLNLNELPPILIGRQPKWENNI